MRKIAKKRGEAERIASNRWWLPYANEPVREVAFIQTETGTLIRYSNGYSEWIGTGRADREAAQTERPRRQRGDVRMSTYTVTFREGPADGLVATVPAINGRPPDEVVMVSYGPSRGVWEPTARRLYYKWTPDADGEFVYTFDAEKSNDG